MATHELVRAFDLGKGSIDEAGDAAYLLTRIAGRQAELDETPARRAAGNPKLPGNRDFWPDKTRLAWHQENSYQEIAKRGSNE